MIDNTNLYLELLRQILAGQNPGHGKKGYYLAASGSVTWAAIYVAYAACLAERRVVDDKRVEPATEKALSDMGAALSCPKEIVPLQLGGK